MPRNRQASTSIFHCKKTLVSNSFRLIVSRNSKVRRRICPVEIRQRAPFGPGPDLTTGCRLGVSWLGGIGGEKNTHFRRLGSGMERAYSLSGAVCIAGTRPNQETPGHLYGLTNFGVNLTELDPGAVSALLHSHSKQDEFIFVLDGNPTLVVGDKEFDLSPGDCMGFKAGSGIAHQLINRSSSAVTYLEMGDRSESDRAEYPNDDLSAELQEDGSWVFLRKDGTAY